MDCFWMIAKPNKNKIMMWKFYFNAYEGYGGD